MTRLAAALHEPYITPYAEERVELPLTFEHVAGAERLTYRDALPGEWMFGALWARCGTTRGGTILWSMVHTLRQRRCMIKGLCRVCGQSATDSETGRLWWVLSSMPPLDGVTPWPTVGPPTCRDHVTEALNACPHLRRRNRRKLFVCTVGGCMPIGVLANLYDHDDGRIIEVRHQIAIGLDETHLLPRALATQLIVSLRDIQPEAIAPDSPTDRETMPTLQAAIRNDRTDTSCDVQQEIAEGVAL
ncbi:hypothetical protein [Streptosporangium saharense]|uniref:hypothetical protein n=1 Tax=Streptosporangium saharense TaxID=1706840 RepID=UPI003320AD5C